MTFNNLLLGTYVNDKQGYIFVMYFREDYGNPGRERGAIFLCVVLKRPMIVVER